MAETLQVRNLAQDPRNHVLRRLRPKNRQGLLLGSGVRMRKKGARMTELSIADLSENLEVLLQGVAEGYLEVTDDAGTVLSVEALTALAGGKAIKAPKVPETVEDLKVPETPKHSETPADLQVPETKKAPAAPKEKPAPKSKKKGLFSGKDKE